MKLKTDYTEKEQSVISELENYAKMLNNFYDFVGNLPSDLDIDILVYSKYLQEGLYDKNCQFKEMEKNIIRETI